MEPPPNVGSSYTSASNSMVAKLNGANENCWMKMGQLGELMNDMDKALYCYENTLRHNPFCLQALVKAATIYHTREQYPKAVEYFQRVLNIESTNGEVWGTLGHCYLMMDDLQKAYTAYQQALYHLPNPKDPTLWYGIGILYDRYGSFDHAEEAFNAVLKMDTKFEKTNEIYFRLGIIYKQQQKFEQSLKCFRFILSNPPRPLVQGDIHFQIGHVHELKKDFHSAKEAYERVLKDNPNHAKVLQQVGWLYHHNPQFGNQDVAINFLTRSIEADPNDGQTWYLLGRCYMAQQKYRKAYDAYQQAVNRDNRNPTFWCSIGVLYYQINQYRDALDAYSRAIRLNPYLSEVWYDLGTLYESCNQNNDSLDAYQRASELDPTNKHIQQRLSTLRAQLSGNGDTTKGKTSPPTLKEAGVMPAPIGSKRDDIVTSSVPSFSHLVSAEDGSTEKGSKKDAAEIGYHERMNDREEVAATMAGVGENGFMVGMQRNEKSHSPHDSLTTLANASTVNGREIQEMRELQERRNSREQEIRESSRERDRVSKEKEYDRKRAREEREPSRDRKEDRHRGHSAASSFDRHWERKLDKSREREREKERDRTTSKRKDEMTPQRSKDLTPTTPTHDGVTAQNDGDDQDSMTIVEEDDDSAEKILMMKNAK